jgi:LmbE family N-acetylglucosaminyl deacetylase
MCNIPGSSKEVAKSFLLALEDGQDWVPADRIAIVVAHPDDETIGTGGLLTRLSNPWILVVTDGAPRNLVDARAKGFESAEAHASARRVELRSALALAGISTKRLRELGIPDQEAAFQLPELAGRLREFFKTHRIQIVFTHPFEGGHPDHDATAFAVHAAAALIGREGWDGPAILEFTSYHADRDGLVVQRFLSRDDSPETLIVLGEEARSLKRRMFDAHATQQQVLARFQIDAERFRPAPSYDFADLPNGGLLHYERFDWGMTAERWQALVAAAKRDLGLGGRG